jgi:glycosyltransferase involved in cell wall biosynthesis
VRKEVPDALLAVSIDQKAPELHASLLKLINDLGLEKDVIVLGSIWEQLPMLYNITTVYCTPSVMEGFGMSAQEAASSGKPVVASNLVPYVCEYLVGKSSDEVVASLDGGALGYLMGEGGMVVLADFVEGFSAAITRLLQDDALRTKMGQRAYEITIPYFTWASRTKDLLDDLGVTPQRMDGGLEVA